MSGSEIRSLTPHAFLVLPFGSRVLLARGTGAGSRIPGTEWGRRRCREGTQAVRVGDAGGAVWRRGRCGMGRKREDAVESKKDKG
jgi:hypothetical protein